MLLGPGYLLFVRNRITCRSWSHHCLDHDNQSLIETHTINNWTKVLPIRPFIYPTSPSKFILFFFFFLLHNSLSMVHFIYIYTGYSSMAGLYYETNYLFYFHFFFLISLSLSIYIYIYSYFACETL